MQEKELLSILQTNLQDRYKAGGIEFIDDFEIGINMLFQDICELFNAGGDLLTSEKIIKIMNKQGTKDEDFEVIRLLYKVTQTQLNKIITSKSEIIIYAIMNFIKSDIDEVEDVYGYTSNEISQLSDINIIKIINIAFEYVVEIEDEVRDINCFYEMANKINEQLQEVI